MTGWTLRRAEAADAAALALVGAATFLETYAGEITGADIVAHCAARHTPEVYADWIAQGWPVWLAEVPGGAAVGYAVLAAPDIPQARVGDLELKRIYVLSRWHRGGLGPALMAAVAAEARRRSAPRLLVGAYARNARALAFYHREGFVRIGRRSFTVGAVTYDDDVVMASALGGTDAAQGAVQPAPG